MQNLQSPVPEVPDRTIRSGVPTTETSASRNGGGSPPRLLTTMRSAISETFLAACEKRRYYKSFQGER